MTIQEITRLHQDTLRLIDRMQFSKATDNVGRMLREASLPELTREAKQLSETYAYMTRYMLDGVEDKGRDRLLSDMSERLRLLADTALRRMNGTDNPGYYYEVWRFNRLRHEKTAAILEEYGIKASEKLLTEAGGNDIKFIQAELESLLERLFNTLFTSLGANRDYADLTKYLLSGYADSNVMAISLSAVTLGLCFFYDSKKMGLLMDVYESSDSTSARARALAGIVVCMTRHSDRIASDRSVTERLSLWQDSIETYTHLRDTIRAFTSTRDTERVTNKLKDEVLPELMKLKPEIMKTLGEKPEIDAATFEDNPEWAEMLSKSGLEEKMRELSDMQSDGADLMMLTFSNLKQFPFFNKAYNWFLPFDVNNTSLQLTEETGKLLDLLASSGSITCDSDLYSMALATNMMPKAQLDMMTGQLSANFDQLREQLKTSEIDGGSHSFDKEVIRVTRDLYRFFKLFRKRGGFPNPFDKPLQFTAFPVLGKMMNDEEILRLMGEFYFKRGYYAEALPLFESIASENSEDATTFEKIGFCQQNLGYLHEALSSYEKASLLKAPGYWLLNKLAIVNRRLGNYDRAAELYSEALTMDPENLNLIMNTGSMLLETGDVTGALSQFYHANYLWPDNVKVIRALAWTELLNGNLTKSASLYERLIADNPQSSDYLNAGHVALLEGNNREALNYYRLSAEGKNNDFETAFTADLPTLIRLGADRSTAMLLLDLTLNSPQ